MGEIETTTLNINSTYHSLRTFSGHYLHCQVNIKANIKLLAGID